MYDTISRESINSFLATIDYSHLLVIFANCLDPDLDQHGTCPPNQREGGHIVFGAGPVGVCVAFFKNSQIASVAVN